MTPGTATGFDLFFFCLGALVITLLFAIIPDICMGITRVGTVFLVWLERKLLGTK